MKPSERDRSLTADSTLELELAEFVSQLADRMQRGEKLEFSAVCREHPHLSEALAEVWGTLVVAQAVADGTRTSPSTKVTKNHSSFRVPELPFSLGDYELQEEVGRGGMGVVYRARQTSLNRTVAIKMIQENRPSSMENRQRFLAEAEATARLEHPGIVSLYEVNEFAGHPFFSMQFIRGVTLADRLRQGPLNQREAARIMADVCRAIAFAHEHGVLHRDLKPSNILLDHHHRPHVTDFGLAKFADSVDSLTRTGAVIGTPSYMSPEQASGRSALVGPAADIYSLGSVLYHLLTGRPPFVAESPMELVLKIVEDEPIPPRLLEPRIDRDLEMIVTRSIQKPPDLRYGTATEMADDLECFLRDEPVVARSGKLTQVVARWFRDTHHAVVLENWGLLWMWHSLVLLIACLLTEALQWSGVNNRLWYAALWVVGLGTWAAVFWALRRRMGPVTFVERQIAHLWGASLIAIALLTPLEWQLNLKPLTLSPVLGIVSGIIFFVKAGILAGSFYIQAACLFATSIFMAIFPMWAHLIFGVVSATCFFVPGLKYFRQKTASIAKARSSQATPHS
jgi:eukaryotic-like serine/threonine-protein kinase